MKELKDFQKALELKQDYAPAHFQSALVSIMKGDIKEAIARLEFLKQLSPYDAGLAFQLGMVYYNDSQHDKAKMELERTVSLNENYSDARYFLGLIYDKQGEKSKAIEQFEKIGKLNPDSEDIKNILNNLRQGKQALEGIGSEKPPIDKEPVLP